MASTSEPSTSSEVQCLHQNFCKGCSVNNDQFFSNIASDETRLLDFFYSHRVLPCHTACAKCKEKLDLVSHRGDNLVFRCQKINKKNKSKRQCNTEISVRKNSFFSQMHLSIRQVSLIVLHYLSRSPPRCRFISNEVGISSKTLIDWFAFMREVFIFWSVENSQVLGGPGTIVEIDEAKIGKRKYNRGRILEGQWVFGGIERGSKNFFVVAVEDRSSATLLEMIKRNIKPQTTIYSDCWKAYDALAREDYQHLTVNHSLNFVDPQTGAHTQHIERSWVEVRKLVPRFGRKKSHYEGYLAECLFMWRFRDHRERLHEFWTAAGKLYPGIPHF